MKILLLPFILISIASQDVEKAVIDHLNCHYPLGEGEYVCDFSRLDLSRIPDAESVAVNGYGKERPAGHVVVYFSFFIDGRQIYKTNGTVRIGILKKVLTSAVPIKSGDFLSADNLKYEIRDIALITEDPIVSDQDISGKVASKFIPSGRIITKTLLKAPPAVSPGDMVNILYDKGLLSLRIGGVAKQEGAEGDLIRVMNIDTRKIIYATVIDSATVTVKQEEGI